jgi:hypothetical protein
VELASLVVTTKDAAFITAVPDPVILSSGQINGTAKLNWNSQISSGQFDVRVSVDDQPSTLFATTGKTGSSNAPWIQAGHLYCFTLLPHNDMANVLATTWVFAQSWDTIFLDGFDHSH